MSTEVLDEAPTPEPPPSPGSDRRRRTPFHHFATAASVRFRAGGGRNSQLSGPAAIAVTALAVLAVFAVWLVIFALVLSGFQEHRAQRGLYAKLRAELAAETAPLGGQISNGAPVAIIDAPNAGIHHAVVVEGTTSTDLQNGPGHRVDTVLPGQAGVSVILAKGVTFGAPFSEVTRLSRGDVITATTGQGTFHYRVADVRYAGDPLPPLLSGRQGRLILVAAVGEGIRAGWAPSQIVYVDADLQGAGKLSPGGGPTVQPADQVVMAGDDSALTPLVLWLELLIVTAVAVVWSRRKWGGWQVWLVGTPALLAVLWLVTETAARLTPNLL